MTKTVGTALLLVLFGGFSGVMLSFISGLPSTPEMTQYEKEFNAIGDKGVSPEKFEELKALSNESLESMKESNFASKNFAIDFILIPALTLVLAYFWFKAGLYLNSYSPQVIYTTVVVCLLALFLFGYFYQPLVHAIGLGLGLFWHRIREY